MKLVEDVCGLHTSSHEFGQNMHVLVMHEMNCESHTKVGVRCKICVCCNKYPLPHFMSKYVSHFYTSNCTFLTDICPVYTVSLEETSTSIK
jgi:hypothetical protein